MPFIHNYGPIVSSEYLFTIFPSCLYFRNSLQIIVPQYGPNTGFCCSTSLTAHYFLSAGFLSRKWNAQTSKFFDGSKIRRGANHCLFASALFGFSEVRMNIPSYAVACDWSIALEERCVVFSECNYRIQTTESLLSMNNIEICLTTA